MQLAPALPPSSGLRRTLLRSLAKPGAGLAALIVALFLYHVRKVRRNIPLNVPVIKTGHWLLGLIFELQQAASEKTHLKFLTNIFKEVGGKTYCAWSFMGAHFVLTKDRRNVEWILKTNFKNYPKGPILRRCFGELLGDGIFNADGQLWYHQRKTTSHMFTANIFKEHIWAVVRRNARRVRHMFEAVKAGEVVDVFSVMNRYTLDTIGEIGFGKSIGSLEDPSSPFLGAFDRAQQNVFRRFIDPRWLVESLFRLGREGDLRRDVKLLDDFSRTIVRELCAALAARDDGSKGSVAWADIEARKSFVGLFIQDAQKRQETLSETYLRDLVLNFLIAGRDTTAQNLAWTFYCLAIHPEVEEKARKEITDVCGDKDPRYEDLNKLPYLKAVLSESLRLYPSVPLDIKYTEADDTWPDGTVLKAGNNVVYMIHSMNRDTDVWGEDAGSFRPERWLEMETPPDSYSFPVFNAGPRECLGKRLAVVEMQGLLAHVLPHVSLRLAVPPEQIKPDAQLTLGMSSGLPCFVERLAGDEQDDDVSTASRRTSEVFTDGSIENDDENDPVSP